MIDDPIVAEIRRVRYAHMQKLNFDLVAIFEDLKTQQQVSGRSFVSFPPRTTKSIKAIAEVSAE